MQIIDQDTFQRANEIVNKRSLSHQESRNIAHDSKNPTLLAGVVYCAHCGAKMSGFMHTDRYKLADGTVRVKIKPKYNCYQRAQKNKGGRDCDGQALYLAETVDAIVLEVVHKMFESIKHRYHAANASLLYECVLDSRKHTKLNPRGTRHALRISEQE